MPPTTGDESSILGGRVPKTGNGALPAEPRKPTRTDGPPDAFSLFCAYYLGVTPDDTYQKPNIDEIARRHGMSADEIRALMVQYGIDPQGMRNSQFDLEGAQLDIRVAPQGISRLELARGIYEDFLETSGSSE